MRRWSEEEEGGLALIRARLKDELASIDQHADTIGDRKLLRFFRGHSYDMNVTCDMISKYIAWRKENNVDGIRNAILNGGCNHPSCFPNGEKILRLIPQIVIDHAIHDESGCPMVFEQYDFRPSEVLEQITLEEYVVFITYCLEYRSLILEQMSEEEERKKVKLLTARSEAGEDLSSEEPYGTLCYLCIIRDLNGVGFDHLGSQGQEIIRAVVNVATAYYPELMRKCYLINAPWIFNTVWWIIKGWLAKKTIEKICVLGTSYLPALQLDISMENLPAEVGGLYDKASEPFPFDLTEGGLLLHSLPPPHLSPGE